MMIDLEKMRELISDGIHGDKRWRDSEGEALSVDAINKILIIALEELISEVERLRGERPAVVAYLRGLADDYGVCLDLSLPEQADIIERGEHRKESP
jgi:hypothetical protein